MDTRKESFLSILPELSARQQDVLSALSLLGSGATFQIARVLGLPDHSISGRITELANKGIIEDTKLRIKNPNSNRNAAVWKLV
jgi:hypothetical protein